MSWYCRTFTNKITSLPQRNQGLACYDDSEPLEAVPPAEDEGLVYDLKEELEDDIPLFFLYLVDSLHVLGLTLVHGTV